MSARRAALASVATAVLLGSLKAYAAARTGSVAVLASLADSVLDFVASLVTLGGVHWASQPADDDHHATSARFWSKFCSWNRGCAARLPSMSAKLLIAPVRNPRPSGE